MTADVQPQVKETIGANGGKILLFPDEASWLEARLNYITSTDVAGILGFDKFKSPLQIYSRKRGLVEAEPDNAPKKRGRRMEPFIGEWYAEETGYEVRPCGLRLYIHPKYDWLAASRDFTAINSYRDKRNLEAKTARFAKRSDDVNDDESWGEAGTDKFPTKYLIQTQIQMACSGLDMTDVATVFTMDDFRIYGTDWNEALFNGMLPRLEEFKACLDEGIPPAIDPERDYALVTSLYKRVQPSQIALTEEQVEDAKRLAEVRKIKSAAEKEEKQLKAKLLGIMKENELGVFGGATILRRKEITKNFQAKAARTSTEVHLRTEGDSE